MQIDKKCAADKIVGSTDGLGRNSEGRVRRVVQLLEVKAAKADAMYKVALINGQRCAPALFERKHAFLEAADCVRRLLPNDEAMPPR